MTYAYDAAGELISASDPNATYTYAYDGVGRSVSSTEQIAGLAATIVLTGRYNAAGYLSELSATVGGTADFVNAYEYDAAGDGANLANGRFRRGRGRRQARHIHLQRRRPVLDDHPLRRLGRRRRGRRRLIRLRLSRTPERFELHARHDDAWPATVGPTTCKTR